MSGLHSRQPIAITDLDRLSMAVARTLDEKFQNITGCSIGVDRLSAIIRDATLETITLYRSIPHDRSLSHALLDPPPAVLVVEPDPAPAGHPDFVKGTNNG